MQAVDTAVVIQSEHIVVSWFVPAAMFAGVLVAGLIFERLILSHLRKLADRTQWRGDDILINALTGLTTIIAGIVGAYAASYFMNVPSGYLALIHKVLKVILIFTGTVVLARIAVGFVGLSSAKEDARLPSASILNYVTKIIVYVIGILVILQSLGISITPILTALGVGGLAVALALQDTLSNLFAGIHIIASRKIHTGDFVRLEGGQEGYVEDISWRTTTLRSLSNFMFIVPNVKVSTTIVADYDQPQKDMGISVDCTVSYGSDLEQVERVSVEVARQVLQEVTGGVPEFQPVVRFNGFGQFGITFSVALRAKQYTDQYLLKHELIKRLNLRFKQEGILIPYPAQTFYLRKEGV